MTDQIKQCDQCDKSDQIKQCDQCDKSDQIKQCDQCDKSDQIKQCDQCDKSDQIKQCDQCDKSEKKQIVICGGTGYVILDDLYAYKHIDVIQHTNYYIKEFAILTKLRKYNHSNIIQILETKYANCFEKTETKTKPNKNLYMIAKYKKYSCDLHTYTCTNDLILVQIMIDILSAVNLMHINNIIHRDIKPGNILLDNSRAIIIDFSHSRYNNRYLYCERTVQTPGYQAPEILNFKANHIYNEKIDIWGIGTVLYDIICTEHLRHKILTVSNKHEVNQTNYIDFFNNVYDNYLELIEKYYTEDTNKLLYKSEYIKWIKQMLAFKPSDRPSANEMLQTILTFAASNGLAIVQPVYNEVRLVKISEDLVEKPLDLISIGLSLELIRNLITSVFDNIDSVMNRDGIDDYAIEIVENILANLANRNYITCDNYRYVIVVCVIIVDNLHFDGHGSIDECCEYLDDDIDNTEKIAHCINTLLNEHGELFF